MPPKSKTDQPETAPQDQTEYATADEMATVLDSLAELSERVDHIERAQTDADRRAAAGSAADDPVFLATTGRGGRQRKSEGARQDEVVQANARRHLFEPAGNATPDPNAPMVAGSRPTDMARQSGDESTGGDGVEDPASPNFEDEGGESQISDDERRKLNPADPANVK